MDTVDLNSVTQQARKVVFRAAGLAPSQQHTLQVRAANGRQGGGFAPVYLRRFALLSPEVFVPAMPQE